MWRLGGRRHKTNYNVFSISDPHKKFQVEFKTNFVDSSYLGCQMFILKKGFKLKQAKNRGFRHYSYKKNQYFGRNIIFFVTRQNCLERDISVK